MFSENGWSKNLENNFGERARMSVPPQNSGNHEISPFSLVILHIGFIAGVVNYFLDMLSVL